MPFRQPSVTFPTTIEKGQSVAITLGATGVQTQGMTPKSSNGQSIVGILLEIEASITKTSAGAWTVSQLFGGLRVTKGGNSNVRLAVNSYKQLVCLVNALTRLDETSTRYFSNPQNAGAVGQSTQTMKVFLPLELRTADVIPQFTFTYNGVGGANSAISGATAGTVTTTITYYYSNMNVQDDHINIVTAPTSLNANTAIDVSTYFAGSTVIDEVWMDVGTDATLEHQTFRIGDTPVYPLVSAYALRAYTNPAPQTITINGLFQMKTNITSFPANGVSGTKPILDVTFTAPVVPTFYLFSKI